ncbi:MAG: type II secretion system protein GspK [Gammaproteobacteria bacterium]|nr:type II secretion system protein GspK [Gammaproteobacteria bacterium]
MALLTVLLVTALASIIAIGMISRQHLSIAQTRQVVYGDQALHYALGAESWVRSLLTADRLEETAPRPVDGIDDRWAQPEAPFELEQGSLRIRVRDLGGLLNLNATGGCRLRRSSGASVHPHRRRPCTRRGHRRLGGRGRHADRRRRCGGRPLSARGSAVPGRQRTLRLGDRTAPAAGSGCRSAGASGPLTWPRCRRPAAGSTSTRRRPRYWRVWPGIRSAAHRRTGSPRHASRRPHGADRRGAGIRSRERHARRAQPLLRDPGACRSRRPQRYTALHGVSRPRDRRDHGVRPRSGRHFETWARPPEPETDRRALSATEAG